MILGYSNITQKGQITIPAVIRKFLGITKNRKVMFVKKNGEIIVKLIPSFENLFGILKKKNQKPLNKELAKENFKNYLAKRAKI